MKLDKVMAGLIALAIVVGIANLKMGDLSMAGLCVTTVTILVLNMRMSEIERIFVKQIKELLDKIKEIEGKDE